MHLGYDRFSTYMHGKKVLIFGLGLLGGGEHVARMCKEAGADVRITDQKTRDELLETIEALKDLDVSYTLSGHKEDDILWADIIIKNPSVPTSHPLIQKGLKEKKEVTTEAALYFRFTNAHTIGVTGTRGKTTTTHMIYETLKGTYPSVLMGGNIQKRSALELLKEETEQTWTVLELSSWQLEGCHWEHVSPHIAVITNINEDHMNRYDSMESYAYDKAAVLCYQKETDVVILNKLDPWTPYFEKLTKARIVYFDDHTLPQNTVLKVPGMHNVLNASACYQASLEAGCLKERILSSLSAFSGVPSRFELIRTVSGVKYINDTTSTTPAALHVALLAALSIVQKQGKIILLSGGASKGLHMDGAISDMNTYATHILLLKGTGTDEIVSNISKEKLVGIFDDMNKAVHKAHELSKPGDVVLLSPGCASFGIFKNEFDRGAQFNTSVQLL